MLVELEAICRSRSEPASRVERARILLAYRNDPSFFCGGARRGGHHQTAQRCVERALAYGPMAALDDRPRPGKEPTITAEAKAWIADLACRKAQELGYPRELWTTRLLARHAREHGPAEGHPCLARPAEGVLILKFPWSGEIVFLAFDKYRNRGCEMARALFIWRAGAICEFGTALDFGSSVARVLGAGRRSRSRSVTI